MARLDEVILAKGVKDLEALICDALNAVRVVSFMLDEATKHREKWGDQATRFTLMVEEDEALHYAKFHAVDVLAALKQAYYAAVYPSEDAHDTGSAPRA